jgi:hypothetical protein
MTFRADAHGREALEWWKARCLEWCYARHEDGKFGDQKYLDDWTIRFKGVHVLRHLGGGLAPWNISRFQVGEGPAVNGIPVVFYHFHALKWFTSGYFELALGYKLPKNAVQCIYRPYLDELKRTLARVRTIEHGFDKGKVAPPVPSVLETMRKLKRVCLGKYQTVSE